MHTKASTGVHYATKHLIMSASPLNKANTDITQEYSASTSAPYVKVPLYDEEPGPYKNTEVGGRILTIYYFDNTQLETVARQLGIYDTDGDDMIEIYISHVFEILPSSQSAWDNLKKAVGKVSNTANNKPGNGGGRHDLTAAMYDGGKDSLLWYRTMKEFVEPGGDGSFWSNGNANDMMYACMNIKVKVKVNPKVYGRPVDVYFYDYLNENKTVYAEKNSFDILYQGEGTYGLTTKLGYDTEGYPYYDIGGGWWYIVDDKVEVYRLKKETSVWDGVYATDKEKTKLKSTAYEVNIRSASNIEIRNTSADIKSFAIYIPVTTNRALAGPDIVTEDHNKEDPTPTPEEPSPTPTETPDDADDAESATVKIVYFDVTKTETDPDFIVKTANAEAAKIGEKYTAKLDIETTSHGDYAVDTVNKDKAYAAYGKTSKVYTQYNKGTKFDASKIEVTADKFKINGLPYGVFFYWLL